MTRNDVHILFADVVKRADVRVFELRRSSRASRSKRSRNCGLVGKRFAENLDSDCAIESHIKWPSIPLPSPLRRGLTGFHRGQDESRERVPQEVAEIIRER